jgi:hypothetical protein
MAYGALKRALARLTLLLSSLALLLGSSHGVTAAPGDQQAVVDEIGKQVSQVRGLPLSDSTPLSVLPRADLVSRLSKDLSTDKAVREFLTSQMLLEVLGAMPRGFDLRQLQLSLLDEQTIAVYDYDARTIFLVADALTGGDLGADTRLVVAHESTHALQDQAFGLKRILPADPPNSDASTAAHALVEGDAMLTMRIWGRQFLRPTEKRALGDDPTQPDPVLDAAPPLVRGELLFPYDAGWIFAQLLYQDGGFDALNQAFARPPTSTEQILHPEKYTAGEQPMSLTIPPLERTLGSSWVTRRTDVFGELVLRLLLEPSLGWPRAEAAAAGWGGDAYTILEDTNGKRVVAMVTAWDTEDDAAQMYNAWSDSIPMLFADAQPTLSIPSETRWSTADYQIQVLTTGNMVRIVYAPDTATLGLVDGVLAGVTPEGGAPVPPSNLPAPSSSPVPLPTGPLPSETGPRTPSIPERPSSDSDSPNPPTVTATPVPAFLPPTSSSPTPDLPAPEPMSPTGGDNSDD